VSGKTRAEVARKLRSATANRDEGLVFDSKKQTVGQYLDQWLSDAVRDSVKQSTYENYEYTVRKHIKPVLGHRKLRDLAPDHVQSLYRAKQDSGLSSRTVHLMHATLHKALRQAVRWGRVPRNVTDAVTPPKLVRKEMQPLSPAQALAFLEAASGDRLEALYVLPNMRDQAVSAMESALS
jgi:integrase